MRSMTGYGRSSQKIEEGEWVVEIHSINRKMLDLHLHLPKEFLSLDRDLRKLLGETLSRGLITVRLYFVRDPMSALRSLSFVDSLTHLKTQWMQVATHLGYDPKSIDLPFLLQQMQTMHS